MIATLGPLEPVTGRLGADFSSLCWERLGWTPTARPVAAWPAPESSNVSHRGLRPVATRFQGGYMLVAWQRRLQGAAWALCAPGMHPRVVIDSSCNTQVVWERDGAQVYDRLSARI